MKLKTTFAATLFVLLLLPYLPVHGQGTNGTVDSFADNSALSEGVKLAKSKKLDQAERSLRNRPGFGK